MALNVQTGVITQPGATGNQTIDLPDDFDPKALIIWGTPQASDDGDGATTTTIDAAFCMGFATYRGGGAQGGYCTYYSDDNNTTSVVARGIDDTAIFKLFSDGATPTVDAQATFVSFGSGTGSNFVINWTNLHTTASIKINYMVLGGSDITDAYVDLFNLAAGATQDVALPSGFGQPDLLFFMSDGALSGTGGDSASSAMPTFSVAKSDTERFATLFNDEDGAGTMLCAGWSKQRAILRVVPTTQAADCEADLSDRASWPTDGFQLTYIDQTASTAPYIMLALKGTFSSKVGYTNNVAGNTTPVDFDHGSTPKGALYWGCGGVGTSEALNTSSAQLGSINLGAYDGTTGVCAGSGNDDGAGVANCWNTRSGSRAMTIIEAAGWGSKATGSFSGTNARLTWDGNTQSTTRFGVLTLGDSTGGGTTPVQLDAGLTLTPAMTFVKKAIRTNAVTLTLSPALVKLALNKRQLDAGLVLTPTSYKTLLKPTPVGLTLTAAMANSKSYPRSLASTLTLTATETHVKKGIRAVSAGLTLTPVLSRVAKYFRTNAVGLTLTPTMSKFERDFVIVPVGLTLTPTLAKAFVKSIAASLVLTATETHSKKGIRQFDVGLVLTAAFTKVNKNFRTNAVTLTLTAAFTKIAKNYRTQNATLTLTATEAHVPAKTLAVGLTLTPNFTKVMKGIRQFDVGLTLTTVIVKLVPKNMPVGLTLTTAMVARALKLRTLAATLTLTAAETHKTIRPVSLPVGLTLTPAMAFVKKAYRTVAVTLTLTPTFVKVNKDYRTVATGLTLTAAETHVKKGNRQFNVGLTLTPVMAFIKKAPRTLAATLVLTATMLPARVRNFAVGLTLTPDMQKTTFIAGNNKTLGAVLTLTPAIVKYQTKAFATGLVLTPVITKKNFRTLAASFTLTPSILKTLPRTLSAALTLSPAVTLRSLRLRTLSASLALTAALTQVKKAPRSFPVSLVLDPTHVRVFKAFRQMDSTVTLTVTQGRAVPKTFAVNLPLNVTMLNEIPIRDFTFSATVTLIPEMVVRKQKLGSILLNAWLGPIKLLGSKFRAGMLGTKTEARMASATDASPLTTTTLGESNLESVDQ